MRNSYGTRVTRKKFILSKFEDGYQITSSSRFNKFDSSGYNLPGASLPPAAELT